MQKFNLFSQLILNIVKIKGRKVTGYESAIVLKGLNLIEIKNEGNRLINLLKKRENFVFFISAFQYSSAEAEKTKQIKHLLLVTVWKILMICR